MAEKTNSPKPKFYADSDMFCSPDPSKIPIPIYNIDGTFLVGNWSMSKRPNPKVLGSKTLGLKL
jgi:hypothetical protein